MHFFVSTYLFLEESKTWNRKNFVIDSSAINSCYLCWFHTSLLCWYQYQVLCCAKSSQSCPSLCDPMDGSPPGSSVHGILRARILGGGVAISPPGYLPHPGLEPESLLHWLVGSLPLAPSGKPINIISFTNYKIISFIGEVVNSIQFSCYYKLLWIFSPTF